MIALWMASLVGHALDIHVGEPVRLPVDTADNLPPTVGFTANARIQPHGEPATWWIEYGPDETYGNATEPRALPGRLEAHFAEDWADGTRQWAAGMSGVQLAHHERGGPDGGPFLRYTDDQGAGNDTNHLDGIGMIHLGPYAYLGNYTWAYPMLPLYLGGGFPDFRGATISVALRGVDWEPHGTEIGTLDPGVPRPQCRRRASGGPPLPELGVHGGPADRASRVGRLGGCGVGAAEPHRRLDVRGRERRPAPLRLRRARHDPARRQRRLLPAPDPLRRSPRPADGQHRRRGPRDHVPAALGVRGVERRPPRRGPALVARVPSCSRTAGGTASTANGRASGTRRDRRPSSTRSRIRSR